MIAALRRHAGSLLGGGRLRTLSLVTVSHGWVAAGSFLQMVLLARILPVAEFGHLATMLAVAIVIEAAVGARGSETALAALADVPHDDLATRHARAARLMRIDIAWSGALYAALAAGVVAYQWLSGARYEWLLVLMAGSFLAFPWGTLKSYLTIFKGPRVFPLIEMSYIAITLFGGVGLSLLMGGMGFVVATVAASLARSVLGWRQSGIPLAALRRGASGDSGLPRRALVHFGATGTVRAGLLNLAGQVDILLLAAASTPTAVALYRTAKTLAGLVQRVTQPVWFVLKRHIIVGARADGAGESRRRVVVASLAFAAIGAVAVPAIVWSGGDIAAAAFGPRYRDGAEALVWLVPGAWLYYGVTGWSNLFGSIAGARMTVIGIYVLQIALFAAVALVEGVTPGSVAFALALSQVVVAVAFWALFLRKPALA